MSARARILARLAETLRRRQPVHHPGPFTGPRPDPSPEPVAGFTTAFRAAGGEVVFVKDRTAAAAWIEGLRPASVTVGATVDPALVPPAPEAAPDVAEVAISSSIAAIAETGTLVLDSRDGRRTQLLAPRHVVVVDARVIQATLADALGALRGDLPSALGLHSGPSKSADIGQVVVRGVHGPGHVTAVVIGAAE